MTYHEDLREYRYIVYQLEQLSNRLGWFNENSEKILRGAYFVWDYSKENISFLKDMGIRNVKYLPIGYHENLEIIQHSQEKDIDILFYGLMNDRRANVLDRLKEKTKTEILYGVYGKERDGYIARSKIVLNIHYYPMQIMEQVRLSYLLNNKCFIISEYSSDNPYGDGIITAKYHELIDMCEYYLTEPDERYAIAEKGYCLFKKKDMVANLEKVLEQEMSS
jgi:spore maturation protein CgeB